MVVASSARLSYLFIREFNFSAPMQNKTCGSAGRGWDSERGSYVCSDGALVRVPRKTANVRDLDEVKRDLRNQIRYTAGKKEVRTTVAGIEYDQCMRKIFGGPDDIRTIIFSEGVRTIRQGTFHNVKSLRIAILNEGLEVLGTDECMPDGKRYPGVF